MNSLRLNMIKSSQIILKTKKWDLNILWKNLNKIGAYILTCYIFLQIILNANENSDYGLILKEVPRLLNGLGVTLTISFITFFISLISGFIFYILMKSKDIFLNTFIKIIKEIILGTPLIVMIFLVVYVLGMKINITGKLLLGILALSFYMTPYMANSYETASAVIGKDQKIIMTLYNFDFYTRYIYIIIPQMIKPLIPSLINNLSSIIKGTALLKIVSVKEISYVITVISNRNYAAIEGYMIMWVMYLSITIPLSLLANKIGRRYNFEN
ncbi:MAG: ABC transporter permease subunit [Fusobacterium sp. JB020]|nr:ABC transporter permease subunit [Fusobacterium sp. JB020]